MEVVSFLQEKDAKQESTVPDTRKNTESNAMSSVSYDITSFKKFQKTVEK